MCNLLNVASIIFDYSRKRQQNHAQLLIKKEKNMDIFANLSLTAAWSYVDGGGSFWGPASAFTTWSSLTCSGLLACQNFCNFLTVAEKTALGSHTEGGLET